MNLRTLSFLPLLLLATACGAAASEDSADTDEASVTSCAEACGLDAVRAANFAKLGDLAPKVIARLDVAVATRSAGVVRFSRAMSVQEIASLGFVPLSVTGDTATVEFTTRLALELSGNPLVLSLKRTGAAEPGGFTGGPVGPPPFPAEKLIAFADYTKLDPSLKAELAATLDKVLATRFHALVGFSKMKTKEEVAALGVDVQRVINGVGASVVIGVVTISVADAVRLTAQADVTVIEEDSALDPFPSTPLPGGSHITEDPGTRSPF